MYIIILAILASIVIIFYSTIIDVSSRVSNDKILGKSHLMIWFLGILLINILMVIVIQIYKWQITSKNLQGIRGEIGYAGRRGKTGLDTCTTKML